MEKSETKKPKNIRGFTLVEILLVMLISSILVLGINSAYQQGHLVWSDNESKRPIYHNVRMLTETLRQELAGLYLPLTSEEDNEEDSSPFSLIVSPNRRTELVFYTLTPSWRGGPASSGIAKIRYRFTMDTNTKETLLQRFEQPCAGERIIGGESSDIVIRGLADFELWVASPDSEGPEELWKQSYNSKDALPRALKVILKWPSTKEGADSVFQACIPIPAEEAVF